MKKLMSVVAGVLVLLLVVLLLWEIVVVQKEAPSIETVVRKYLDARKMRDVEGMYAQMLTIEEGGKYTQEALERSVIAWPRVFFEKYQTVDVRVTQVIRDRAIVKGTFFYGHCDIWFNISLVHTAKGWRIHSIVMPIHEDNLNCVEEE